MSLWSWVVGAYERPGVPEICLQLQDAFGQNTSLLLWAFQARASEPALLDRAAGITRAWDETALKPLRGARRALKPPLPPVDDGARETLREQVKAAELHAERVLVETLERLGGDTRGEKTSGLAALAAASRAWGSPAPDVLLASLAAALE